MFPVCMAEMMLIRLIIIDRLKVGEGIQEPSRKEMMTQFFSKKVVTCFLLGTSSKTQLCVSHSYVQKMLRLVTRHSKDLIIIPPISGVDAQFLVYLYFKGEVPFVSDSVFYYYFFI